MAKTVQISTSPIGEKHACLVALQSDGSLWAYTFYHGQPAGGGEWVRLPDVPPTSLPDDPMPMG